MPRLAGVLLALLSACSSSQGWRDASREPVGLAPDPAVTPEAVIQVYGARTWGWKGAFGVHTWVAAKPSRAASWTVYEVIGWRLRWSDSAVVVSDRLPDGRWFGSTPELYAEKRGNGVDELIERIDKAARSYPYAAEYRLWPGPNSNTFTAWLTRTVPELGGFLPPRSARTTCAAESCTARRAGGDSSSRSPACSASRRARSRVSSSTCSDSLSA
jgi:hypothetical protein